MPTYKIHPLAEVFPPFTEKEFNELVKDIGEYGQKNVITLYEGKILDGVHRYKACQKLHMEPRVRNLTSGDPVAFVVSANLKRRNLDESQRALIAAELSNGHFARQSASPAGESLCTTKSKPSNVADQIAASAMGVGVRSVERARKVIAKASPGEVKKIREGKVSLAAVEKKIKGKEEILDSVGRPIPEDLIPEWRRAEEVGKQLQSLARKIKSIVSEGFSGAKQDRIKDSIYAELNNSIISDAQALSWSFTSIIPYALCPTCSGRNRKECTLCRKRGWISKFLWNSPAVNENVRKMIERKAS